MNTGLWIEIGTLLVATVGVVGGLLALRRANRQRWLEPDQWNVWHAWLAEDAARAQVDADLIACKAPVDRFLLLRECSSVSAQHSWKECPARVRAG